MSKISSPLLASVVSIKEQFARSTRIDKDQIDTAGFIYSQSIDAFLKMLIRHQKISQQGAYTWTGPYGSGKSTLALSFSSILIGSKKERQRASAAYNQETARELWDAFPPRKKGWKIFSIVGSKTTLENLLEKEIDAQIRVERSDEAPFEGKQRQQLIIDSLENYLIQNNELGGIVLLIDEMGKLLEAASDGAGDVYFYQLLAEAASRSNGRLIIIGILHQSFQEYANTATKRVRDEWGKIHGRFVDLSINLTSSEQIELIASAISSPHTPDYAKTLSNKTFKALNSSKRSPSSQLEELLNLCWPLNPLTALCLGPISKRSYGQNQRSIFSFLTSGEPLGLKEFISKTRVSEKSLYDLSNLWDYLELNWGSSIAVSGDSHHFANVKDALSRLETLEDAKLEYSKILKAISILTLSQQLTGVGPSHEALHISLNLSLYKITKYTNYLKENSLIIFKKYKNAFALYEGSDFNIDAEMEEALKTASRIKLSNVAKQFLPSEVIAKRHYFKTGTLRWSEIAMCNPTETENIIKSFEPSANRFGLFLIIDTADTEEFLSLTRRFEDRNFVIFGQNTLHADLNDYLAEYIALNMISQSSSTLLKDKVARREVRDRSEAIHDIIEEYFIKAALETDWLLNGKIQKMNSLNKLSSDLADRIFKSAPIIKNELINRTKTSGSANAATKALLNALVTSESLENLGFIKFPAERGIYESVIKKNNLHPDFKGKYRLVSPTELAAELDRGKFQAIWTDTIEFMKANSDRKVNLKEIHEIWSQPPYGLKAGLFPLLSTLFYLINKEQIAYYREEIFVTKIQDFDIDYFLRTPSLIQLRWMNMDQKSRRLLTALATIPAEILGKPVLSIEQLEVAKALIATFDNIEPWAKRTASISENAKSVRTLFKRASDPAQFTLNDLPKIYGDIDLDNEESLSILVSKIKDGLEELRSAFGDTLKRFQDYTLSELGISSASNSSLREINNRALEVKGMSGNNKIESFVLQLSKVTQDINDFEKLAWIILSKPTKNWIDQDIDRLFIETINLCREFKNIETMAALKDRREASFAFALVQHSKGQASKNKTKVFELTENELKEATEISKKLRKIKINNGITVSQKALLAALSIIATED